MASGPPPTIDDLGLPAALHLAALVESSQRRCRIAPTRRMTLALMGQLRDLGLIQVPWPEARWDAAPDAHETPIEGLQWRYAWAAYQPEGLPLALTDYLQAVPRDDFAIALRLKIWRELAIAEAEAFFEAQLAKHQFDAAWAQDLVFVHRDCGLELSAAQWRYCAWAATRQGAAFAQQQRVPDAARVREVIFAELRRRIGPVASGQWSNTSFVPYNPRPDSALSALFVEYLTSLGPAFWQHVPSELALLAPAQPRQAS
jgi:hypothetical protein